MRILSIFGLLLISTNLFAFGGDMGGGRRVIELDHTIIEAIALKSGAVVGAEALTDLDGVRLDFDSVHIDLSSSNIDSLLLSDGIELPINARIGGDGGGGGR